MTRPRCRELITFHRPIGHRPIGHRPIGHRPIGHRPIGQRLIGPHRRPWTAGLAVIAVAGIALLAAGCGGGSGGSSDAVAHLGTTTTSAAKTSGAKTSGAGAAAGAGASASSSGPNNVQAVDADLVKFASCMRADGVPNFPNPIVSTGGSGGQQVVSIHITAGPGGLNKASPQFQHATKSCQKYLPPATPTSEHITTAEQADYLKAAQCMRAHGINGFPDPDFSNGNVSFPLPQGMSPNTPQFEAARHICQNMIPNGLPYSSTDENP